MDLKSLIVLFGIVCCAQASEENYCDPMLCEDGMTHTACDHYLEFAQACGEDPEILTMTGHLKKIIIDFHNQFRNKCALGKLPGYAPAARMATMRWNDDLEYVAALHSRSCTAENDNCRNTRIFKNVGQNIGYEMTGEPVNNASAVIKHIIDAWNNEYKLGNQNNVKYLTPETLETMGRFTNMVNDRATDVGCALVRFTKDDLFHVYFTCNYGSNNRLEQKVYETGPHCSGCTTGCNKMYSGLCSNDEKIDPNHEHIDKLRSFN